MSLGLAKDLLTGAEEYRRIKRMEAYVATLNFHSSTPVWATSTGSTITYEATFTTGDLRATEEYDVMRVTIKTAAVLGGIVGQVVTEWGDVIWQSEPMQDLKDSDGDYLKGATELAHDAAKDRVKAALSELFTDPVVYTEADAKAQAEA